ncbi:MAG: TIGR01777 family protein [Magnetococcales bacterium]|nr:TIGR01777 family protein [Magnetococcales bacterium]
MTQATRGVLVAGATGFIGRGVMHELLAGKNRMTVWTRRPETARRLWGDRVGLVTRLEEIPADWAIEGVINLAGQPTVGAPWTRSYRDQLVKSRVDATRALTTWMAGRAVPPQVLVNASAVGFYGDRGEENLTEESPPGQGFLAELCLAWEEAARSVPPGTRLCITRFGLVLGRDGGVWQPFLRSARLGLGAVLGEGRQWMPWVHRADVAGVILRALDTPSLQGPINVVAPGALRQREFMTLLARRLHRPLWMKTPAFLLRLLPGEMGSLFLDSQHVLPQKARDHGYDFRYSELSDALEELLGRL